jgi:plastocyanin
LPLNAVGAALKEHPMLTKLRTGAAAVLALAALAGPAAAMDHEVLIVDGAYFPPVIFASIGDSLTFINESSDSHEVMASDESWRSGMIPIDGTFSLEIQADTHLTFNATAETDSSDGSGDIFLEQVGEIVLGPDQAALTD